MANLPPIIQDIYSLDNNGIKELRKPIITPINLSNVGNKGRILIESAGILKLKAGLAIVQPNVLADTANNNLSPKYSGVAMDDARIQGASLKGPFNIPIFDLLTFQAISYLDQSGKIWQSPDLEILTCLIEVTQNRHIVTTPIQGRNGTIKEYISDDDYNITITGLLSSNYQDIFPQEELDKLLQFCGIPSNFKVTSPLLNNYFGVTNIVVSTYTFNEVEGDRSNISFQISALSEPVYNIQTKTNPQ